MKSLLICLILSSSLFAQKEEIKVSPHVRVVNEKRAYHSGGIIYCGDTIKVLTCSHMLSEIGIKRCQVEFYYGDNYISLPAKIVKYDHNIDLMLLEVENIGIKTDVLLIGGDYKDPHVLIGRPSYEGVRKERLVRTNEANMGEAMMFGGIAVSGMSGGAVLNSEGELVSIQSTKGQGTTTGCSLREIRKFLLK